MTPSVTLPINLELVEKLDPDAKPWLVSGDWQGSTIYIVQKTPDGPKVHTFVVGPYSVMVGATRDGAIPAAFLALEEGPA